MSNSLRPHGLYSPWNSLGQNTELGSLSLLHGIFPTQGSNPRLPHCRQILYQLSHKGSPRKLEWAASPFSRDLPDPGIEPGSPVLQGDSLPTELLVNTYQQVGSSGITVECLSFNQPKWSTIIVKSSSTIYHTVIS